MEEKYMGSDPGDGSYGGLTPVMSRMGVRPWVRPDSRLRAADDLHQVLRANPPGKRGADFVSGQIVVALTHTPRFVERQADLGAGEQNARDGVLARLLQRHLTQQQRLGLM